MKIPKIVINEQKRTIAQLYVRGYTFKEIGKHLDISHVRVHKIWHDIMRYCIIINGWSQSINNLPKKEMLKIYGASIVWTLETR